MWLLINEGFFSIVKNRDKKNTYLIRARKAEHIIENFGEDALFILLEADYPYRCNVSKDELLSFFADYIDERLVYGNFKSSLVNTRFIQFCSEVWYEGWRFFHSDRPTEEGFVPNEKV